MTMATLPRMVCNVPRGMDKRMRALKLHTVKMTYDPAACEGKDADDITFADLEYVATNDNGGMSPKKATLLAVALIALTVSGLYWL